MNLATDIGLCCGSIVQADLFELADAAAHAGFSAITIWPTLYRDALAGGASAHEVRSRLDELDVRVIELDPVCTWLPVEIPPTSMTARFADFTTDDLLAIAQVLGCEALNVIRADHEAVSDEQMIEHLGAFADRAGERGMRVQFEFLPWSPVADLEHATRVVAGVGRDNCGVHIDVWHHIRSGGTIEQLATVDPRFVAAVQLSDLDPVPWDDLLAETASGRRLPGDGDNSAARAVNALDEAGARCPVNVEVFSADLMGLAPVEAARALAASLDRIARGHTGDVADHQINAGLR